MLKETGRAIIPNISHVLSFSRILGLKKQKKASKKKKTKQQNSQRAQENFWEKIKSICKHLKNSTLNSTSFSFPQKNKKNIFSKLRNHKQKYHNLEYKNGHQTYIDISFF